MEFTLFPTLPGYSGRGIISNFSRTALAIVACASLGLVFAAPSAFANTSGIQMLPPVACPSNGTGGILTWDSASPIACAAGISVNGNGLTSTGNITANSLAGTTLSLTGASAPLNGASANALLSLEGISCAANQALTKAASGSLVCVNVTDLQGVGTVSVPSCPAGQQLYFTGSGFTCVALPAVPAVPTCAAGQYLTGDGTTLTCVTPTPITGMPSCAAGQTIVYNSSGQPICSTAAPVMAEATGNIVGAAQHDAVIQKAAGIEWPNDTVDYNDLITGCSWGSDSVSDTTYNQMMSSPACQAALCTGTFGKYPVLYAIVGSCNANTNTPTCQQADASDPGAPVINESCFYNQ
jgi:hypothetical protein